MTVVYEKCAFKSALFIYIWMNQGWLILEIWPFSEIACLFIWCVRCIDLGGYERIYIQSMGVWVYVLEYVLEENEATNYSKLSGILR